jgi:hypothetical protein
MSGIQSLLAIGAVLLFGLVTLRFNSSVIQNISLEVENKVYLTAFSLADDMIEEIKQKAFDEKTLIFPTPDSSQLTLPNSLGSEGESWPYFDDIDDYNNYSRPIGLPYVDSFFVSTQVYYVLGNNPDQQTTATQTFYKKVEATVTSPYMSIPVKLSFVFTLK